MNHFIIIEGPDFTGKSTQINLFDRAMCKEDPKMYMDTFFTREPGSYLPDSEKECEEIRKQILHGNNTLLQEAELFAKARFIHTKEIVDMLTLYKNCNIISDRYIVSSLAYQGFAQKLGKDVIYQLNKPTLDLLNEHNITIDCVRCVISEDVWQQRRNKRLTKTAADSIESKDIHEQVLEFFSNQLIYEYFTKDINMITHIVDCNGTIEEVQENFKRTMNNILY
jgi:dTMP kinase